MQTEPTALAAGRTTAENHRPVTLLWAEDPRRGRLVVACCPRARVAGIRVGMPIAQATEICSHFTSDGTARLRCEKHAPEVDRQTLEQVAWCFQQNITPLVAIEALDDSPWAGHPRHQPESLLCDITGAAHLFGGEVGVLEAATELLTSIGLAGRIAIADSVGAAWAVAHQMRAKTHAPQDRCFLVPAGQTRPSLETLSPAALRIPQSTVDTLARLGVQCIGHLLRLPRSGLAPRLGVALVRRIEQALGEVEEPLGVYRAPAEHRETLTLQYATADQTILADRIERLTEKIRVGLAAHQRGALRIECRLDLAVHPPLTFEVGLFAPTIDASHLSELMIYRLESTRLPSSVLRVTVSVTLTGPLRTSQRSLFAHQSGDSTACLICDGMSGSSISRLIDSLSGRLGRESVVGIKLEKDPLPENAFSIFPLAGNSIGNQAVKRVRRGNRQSSRSSSSRRSDFKPLDPSSADAMRRPLSLLNHPLPLAVAFSNESFVSHASKPRLPDRVRIDGVIHEIVRSWGPERIETGWWKGPSIGREYYRIETNRGQWCWIYRNLISNTQATDIKSRYRWMLHGRFA